MNYTAQVYFPEGPMGPQVRRWIAEHPGVQWAWCGRCFAIFLQDNLIR